MPAGKILLNILIRIIIMKKQYLIAILSLASIFILSACSGSGHSSKGSSNSSDVPVKLHGQLHAKNPGSVAVYAVPIDNQGQPSQVDGYLQGKDTKTKADGSYETEFEQDYVGGAGVLLAYPDKDNLEFNYSVAIGTILFDSFGQGSQMKLNINWITSLASDFAYTSYIDENGIEGNQPNKAMAGIYTAYTIERANLWLSKQFKISDIASVTPILPSKLNQYSQLTSPERSEGIRYGALLAAGDSLSTADGEWEWFKKVRQQQRAKLGQLYKNAPVEEFSMCALYSKAADLLGRVINESSPSEASGELAALNSDKEAYCADSNNLVLTQIDVDFEKIDGWANAARYAEEFLIDLDQRLTNIAGDAENTCEVWSIEFNKNKNCVASFFDPTYIKSTKDFHQPMQDFYAEHKEVFKVAQRTLLNSVFELTKCIDKESKDKPCGSFKKDGLTFTYIPYVDENAKERPDKKYNSFDFFVSGTTNIKAADNTTIAALKFSNLQLEDKDKTILKPRVRITYDEAFEKPPVTAIASDDAPEALPDGVEPLGFDIEFPKLEIDDFAGHALEVYMAYKIIGVRPHQFEETDTKLPYHYNYTQLVLQNAIEKNSDEAQVNIVIKTSNGANFYAKKVWPDLEPLFDKDGGDYFYGADKAGDNIGKSDYDKIDDLFTYALKEDQKIVLTYACKDGKPFNEETFKCTDGSEPEPQYGQADYFEIQPKGLPINRYELYEVEQAGVKYKALRNCAISADSTLSWDEKEQQKVCGESQSVLSDFQLFSANSANGENTLFEKDGDDYKYFSLFAIPGYGAYKPEFPQTIDWVDNQPMAGKRTLLYSHGLTDFSMLIDQKFDKQAPGIAKITFSKNTPTSWEAAISLGYDYDEDARDALEKWGLWMEQGVVAAGDKAQSLYFSYFVNDDVKDSGTSYTELSSLVVFRGGIKFMGSSAADAAGVVIAGNNKYSSKDDKGCGYLFEGDDRKEAGACLDDEVAYLTFRSALVAVIREEKEGEFIARFSDGRAVKLGFMQSLPKIFLDPLHKNN